MSTTPTRAIIAIAFLSLHRRSRVITLITSASIVMYRLAYRNFGGNPVQESLVGNVTVKGGKQQTRPWSDPTCTNSETRATRPRLPQFFRRARMTPIVAYRWMGSIAMDKDHNIALGYSKSSPIGNTINIYHRAPQHRPHQHVGR